MTDTVLQGRRGRCRTFAATPTAPFSLASAHSASSSRVPFCSVRMVRRMDDSWEDHSPRHAPVLRWSSWGWWGGVQAYTGCGLARCGLARCGLPGCGLAGVGQQGAACSSCREEWRSGRHGREAQECYARHCVTGRLLAGYQQAGMHTRGRGRRQPPDRTHVHELGPALDGQVCHRQARVVRPQQVQQRQEHLGAGPARGNKLRLLGVEQGREGVWVSRVCVLA